MSRESAHDDFDRRKLLVGASLSTLVWATPTVSVMAQVPACVGSATSQAITVSGVSTSLDSWRSNLVVDEVERYVNTSGRTETILPTTVVYESGRAGVLMTPFFVRILGNDSFVVLAIGDAIASSAVGIVSRPFSVSPQCFEFEPGWVLGIGFIDANADGSSSTASVVRFENGGNEIWYSGGFRRTQAGSVVVGLPPIPGNSTLTNLRRNYILDYQFEVNS